MQRMKFAGMKFEQELIEEAVSRASSEFFRFGAHRDLSLRGKVHPGRKRRRDQPTLALCFIKTEPRTVAYYFPIAGQSAFVRE